MSAEPIDEKAVFNLARRIDAREAREDYLQQVCGAIPDALRRVVELLQVHEQEHSFLESPAVAVHATIDQPPLEKPGTVIGPYRLLEQIGEGGFGVVFMAEQTLPMRRKVALKILKPGMDTRQVVARFEAERQALALMDHPNIARILDGGATPSGRPYFVMELVRGICVTEFCDQNHLPVRERLDLFISVCQAVGHAHQKGVIHRDLKPSNILVTLHDGRPVAKIIDFGISKALGQQLTEKTLFTNFALMIGTPVYMSPEQAEMSGLDIDTRSDIYSLGVLLYELLTGTPPRDQECLRNVAFDEMRRIIREEEPARPSARITTLGQAGSTVSANRQSDPSRLSRLFQGELDWIVMKALEKDRNRRYDTAGAFAADLQRYLCDEHVHACPPSASYRLRKFLRRHKGRVLAGSLLLMALVGGIIGTTLGMIRARNAEAKAVSETKLKETALLAARQSEQDATDQLFLALLNQARAGRYSRQMGQRLDSLTALEKAARIRPDERLRDEAIAALALPDLRGGPSLHGFPAGTERVAVDGSYATYARLNDQGIVSIRSIPQDEELRNFKLDAKTASAMTLSPNGEFLALIDRDFALHLWPSTGERPLFSEPLRPCACTAFSPNSRQVAIATDDWIRTIDLVSGQETIRWRLPARASALAFHADNRRLAVGYSNHTVVSIYDAGNGSHIVDLPVGLISRPVVTWHPNEFRLAVAGSDPRIQIWDVAAKRTLTTLEGHVEQVASLSFHPHGDLLASSSWDGTTRLWEPTTGRPLMQMSVSWNPEFSSTGKWLGYVWQGGERMQLMETILTPEYRTLDTKFAARFQDGDISPDGRLLAMGMGDGGDRIWDLPNGREIAALPTGGACTLFHFDGEVLTCGATGLFRWPIRQSEESAKRLRLGPPKNVPLPFVPIRATRGRDGRTLAIVSETGGAALLMDIDASAEQGRLLPHPSAHRVVLSCDGRLAATCGWHSDRVRLWDAKTGNMIHEWVLDKQTEVFFTPDNRALIICKGDAYTFWDVETLQPILRLAKDVALYPGYVAFSPDGGLMAMEMAPALIHLKEVASGRTVAKLEDPHGDRAGWMGFTPDGTQLVVSAHYAKAIHVWNLGAIRQRLKAIDLDWHWPEFKPGAVVAKTAQPIDVEVLAGDLTKPLEVEAK